MKESINQILRAVGLKAEEIKLEQQMLADGVTTIEAEMFEAGQPVFVVTEDATVALPIGEYELASGQILVVAEEGIIAEIREASEPEAEAEVEVEQPEMEMGQPEAPAAKKVIESIIKETQFSKVEEQAKEIEALKAQITELKAALEPKTEEVELSSDEPAAEAITFNPENEKEVEVFKYAKNRSMSTMDRVLSMMNK